MVRNVPRNFVDMVLDWLLKSFVVLDGVASCYSGIVSLQALGSEVFYQLFYLLFI